MNHSPKVSRIPNLSLGKSVKVGSSSPLLSLPTLLLIEKQRKTIFFLLWLTFMIGIIMLGATANFLAVTNNGGLMPVDSPDYFSATDKHIHFSDLKEINYKSFADIFNFRVSKYNLSYSVGDVLMLVGLLLVIFFAVCVIYQNHGIKKLLKRMNYDKMRLLQRGY